MYQERFDQLFAAGRPALLGGALNHGTPPVEGGTRWPLSAVFRPGPAAAARIDALSAEAAALAGPGHWRTGAADSSHLTLRALDRYRGGLPDDDPFLQRCTDALAKAAAGLAPIAVRFTGVTLTSSSVMLCAEPDEPGVLERLRAAYGEALGADGWCEDGFTRNIWYANLVHFAAPAAAEPERLAAWVEERRRADLGADVLDAVELVTYRLAGGRIRPDTCARVVLAGA